MHDGREETALNNQESEGR